MFSSFAFSQSEWTAYPPLTGDVALSIVLTELPAANIGDEIAVFVTNGNGTFNLGQGTIIADGTTTGPAKCEIDGYKDATLVADSDPITVIQIYKSGTDTYYELDLTTGIPANPVVDQWGFGFFSYDNEGKNAASQTVVLSVELSAFTAKFSNKTVALNWATASEENNEYFTVERSTNGGKDFEALDNIAGAGTTLEAQEYAYTDEKPENGVNYYRLKQTDFDGKFTYSEVIAVRAKKTELTVNIFPNPVVSVANINLPTVEGEVRIRVVDMLGREVISKILSNTEEQTIQLDLNELQTGIYMIKVASGEQVISKQIQIIK